MRTENSPTTGNLVPSPRRIKQEARQIRRREPTTKQGAALDRAAQARGWSSYKAFERDWRNSDRGQVDHQVTLVARWVERNRSHGVLRALVPLSEPWDNHLPLPLRRRIGALRQFHIVQGDRTRLVAHEAFTTELSCIHTLSKAARQLMFVDVMRVHPASIARAEKAFDGDPYGMLTTRYPDMDHQTLWCVPANGLHFILNEPYDIDQVKQGPVLAARQMVEHTSRDWTTHNPEGTLAQLIARSEDSQLFDQLVKRSNLMPERLSQIHFSDGTGAEVTLFR